MQRNSCFPAKHQSVNEALSNEAHTVLKQASSSSPIHCIKFNQHSRSTQLHKHSRH